MAVRSWRGGGSIFSRSLHTTLDADGDAAGIRVLRGDREPGKSRAVLEYRPGESGICLTSLFGSRTGTVGVEFQSFGYHFETSNKQIEFLLVRVSRCTYVCRSSSSSWMNEDPKHTLAIHHPADRLLILQPFANWQSKSKLFLFVGAPCASCVTNGFPPATPLAFSYLFTYDGFEGWGP